MMKKRASHYQPSFLGASSNVASGEAKNAREKAEMQLVNKFIHIIINV